MQQGSGGETVTRLGKADLHIHTATGDGADSIEDLLAYVEHNTDLDVIAITDHDEVRGALEAMELVERMRYRVQVVPGVEVSTRSGHLIGLFIEKRPPMLKSLEYTVEAIHALGGVCIVPHPFSWLTMSVGEKRLLRMQRDRADMLYIDGLETFNPTYAGRVTCKAAQRLNCEDLRLAETGGSDAHHAILVGTGRTLFPGRTAADLRKAIEERTTKSTGRHWTVSDHLHGVAGQQWRAMIVHPYRKLARTITGGKG